MKKKKSLREKGNDFQIWIRNWLQERGWIVRNFPMTSKPILVPERKGSKIKKLIWLPQDNDVFGCDLIARKGNITLWIQASLDEHITRRLQEFSIYFKNLTPFEFLMIWIKREKWKSIKRVRIDSRGALIVEDVGKITAGKFIEARGAFYFLFGEKEKKK